MKRLLLLFLVTFLLSNCTPTRNAQGIRFADMYAGKLEPGSKLLASTYQSTLERTKDGRFVYKTYYPDTRQMTHFYTYTDEKLKLREGRAAEWWDDGKQVFETTYRNGLKEGESVEYYSSSVNKGVYRLGLAEGLWITLDSLGNKTAEFTYAAGKRHGPFKIWNKEGKLEKEGSYTLNELDWQEIYIEDEASENDVKLVEEFPLFPGCDSTLSLEELKKCSDETMLRFIYERIKYPAKAREYGIEGTAVTQFVVEKDGSISKIKARRGVCREIGDECVRIVSSMPAWIPGRQNGKAVRVQFNLPVKFRLE